jgi:hypothetical protein
MLRFVSLGLALALCGAASVGCGSSSSGGGASAVAGSGGVTAGGSGGVGVGVGGSGGAGGLAGASGAGGGLAGGGQGGGTGGSAGGASARVRIVAANVSSGNDQSYTGGEGERLLQGLAPDLVLIQELNVGSSSDAEIQAFTDQIMGTPAHYVRESGVQIPNGILSRHPIVQSGDWVDPSVTNRGFLWARIDVPGDDDVWAFSVHLLTSGPTQRDTEAKALVAFIKDAVPAGSLLVLGGDFNTSTRDEACIGTFATLFATAPPYPADGLGNDFTNGPRSKPHDWLLPDPGLHALEAPVKIGQNVFPNGLVFDSRVYTPLDDVAPAMMADSGATGMQHMAVVKDFLFPTVPLRPPPPCPRAAACPCPCPCPCPICRGLSRSRVKTPTLPGPERKADLWA